MKPIKRIIVLALLAVTLIAMFLPVASFNMNATGDAEEAIAKQQSRVDSTQKQLDRWIEGGKKSEADIAKQRAKVEAEQAKLDQLIAEMQEKAAQSGDENALKYALLPAQLPSELELDQTLINQFRVYEPNFQGFYVVSWAAFGLLAAAAVFLALAGNKLVSKFYTFSVFAHLLGIIALLYTIFRLISIPIKAPYASASLNTVITVLLVACPLLSFAIHVTSVQNSKRSMIYVFCSFLSALAIVPFWIMMVNATRNTQAIQQSVSLIPSTFLGSNWNILTSKNFNVAIGFKNSAIIAFGSTILSVYFSAMTAYGFKVYQFKGSKFLYAVVMAIIMIPGQVTGTGFFMFMYQLGLTNNYIPLIIPAIAAASTVFFFRQYLEANFQISLVEAARIDGAGEFFTFNRIVLPIMLPAMATMGIMAVIGSWNNYLTPLMLFTKPDLKTLPMMVQELRGDIYRTEYGSIYLGLTLTALPLIIVYFAFSKYIIAGVALGGVKE